MNSDQTAIKYTVFSLAGTVIFFIFNILPLHSFPQWKTIEGKDGSDLQYDFNSLKSLPNGIKQIDTYMPSIGATSIYYISCAGWKSNMAGSPRWEIMPPNSMIETLAFKVCGRKSSNVIKRKINNADYYIQLGKRNIIAENFLKAIADFTSAIEIAPRNVDAYFNRGLSRSELGDQNGAIMDYDQAIALNPAKKDAYINRGVSKLKLFDNIGALLDFDKVIAIDPLYASGYAHRGLAKFELGDEKGAILDYNKATSIDPYVKCLL